MSLTTGPNLGLLVNGAQGEAHYSQLMSQWRGLDGLVQARVLDKDLATPPGSPSDGDMYIVATGGTAAWTGLDGKLVRRSTVAATWEVYTPKSGWVVYVVDETSEYRYSGSAWVPRLGSVATNLIADVTNTRDIGSSGVKWRSGYFGTSVVIGTDPGGASNFRGAGGALWANDTGGWTWYCNGGAARNTLVGYHDSNNRTSGGSLLIEHSRGTLASSTDLLAGDYIGGIRFFGRINGAFRESAYIHVRTGAAIGATDYESYYEFWGTDAAATTQTMALQLRVGKALFSGDVDLASGKVYKVNGTQVVSSRRTGWAAWTGTATRTSVATGSATTQNVAEALKALLDDLIAHGLIGA